MPPRDQNDQAGEHHDVEMDFFDHLEELRRRIIRLILWATLGISVTWYLVPAIGHQLTNPLASSFHLIWHNLYDSFMLYVKISFVSGIIIFSPLIFYELWAFVAPALTRNEKKFVWITLPFSIVLFFAGIAMCYYCVPLFIRFFVPYFVVFGKEDKPSIDAQAWVGFLLICFLVFGLSFQLPLIVIFLAKLGMVDYVFLARYRRHAYFVITVVVSIVMPTWDPITLLGCAIPVCLLYEMSIWIVKFFIKPL